MLNDVLARIGSKSCRALTGTYFNGFDEKDRVFIHPQPKAFFLQSTIYFLMYGMFCAAVSVVLLNGQPPSQLLWIALTLFVWGVPFILIRCLFAYNNNSCELFRTKIVVKQGMFGWWRTFHYEDLSRVMVEYSPLFGKSIWYVYFYTKKSAQKKYWPYSASIVGISESDARNIISTMSEHDVEVDVNGLIMSSSVAK